MLKQLAEPYSYSILQDILRNSTSYTIGYNNPIAFLILGFRAVIGITQILLPVTHKPLQAPSYLSLPACFQHLQKTY